LNKGMGHDMRDPGQFLLSCRRIVLDNSYVRLRADEVKKVCDRFKGIVYLVRDGVGKATNRRELFCPTKSIFRKFAVGDVCRNAEPFVYIRFDSGEGRLGIASSQETRRRD
jgi:hypothetical protein